MIPLSHTSGTPASRRFAASNAYTLGQAALWAYHQEAELRHCIRHAWGPVRCTFIEVADTQLLVAADEQAAVVAFRGTEDRLADWLTDANLKLTPGPMAGAVHAGFYWSLSLVWRLLDEAVNEFTGGLRVPLWVTGHSLGGALAHLAVARWLEAGQPVAGLYTFGQPRSGDVVFARNFNFAFRERAFRLVNHNDLVTRIPPRSFGFSHCGSLQYFCENGVLSQQMQHWNSFLSRWRARIDALMQGQLDGLADHSMRQYLKLLAPLASASPGLPDDASPAVASPVNVTRPRRRAA